MKFLFSFFGKINYSFGFNALASSLFLWFHSQVDYKRSELQEEWPNLLGDDFAFWSQQWKRHGRCLYGMTPKSYFDTAIVVMEEVGPLLQLLRVAKGTICKYGIIL